MARDDEKGWHMETPRPVPTGGASATTAIEVLSRSAIQRALRRASNPAYSGSPSSSQQNPNGVLSLSTAVRAADEQVQTGMLPQAGRGLAPLATLPSKTPSTSSKMPRPEAEMSLSRADHAVFRLKDAEADTRISGFPLQGGDSFAGSPSCSLHGSARHSLCADDLASVTQERSIEYLNAHHNGRIAAAFDAQHMSGNDDVGSTAHLQDGFPEASTDVVQSALNPQPSSDCSAAHVLQTSISSPQNSVCSGSVLDTASCVPMKAASDLEALPDSERSLIAQSILKHEHQLDIETNFTTEALALTPKAFVAATTASNHQSRLDNAAKDHHVRDTHGSNDEVSSESSVSVGSYLGQSPRARSTNLLGPQDSSPFTFTTMPDAGHGSPQNHCFMQTPPNFVSYSTSTPPNVVRALFKEDPAFICNDLHRRRYDRASWCSCRSLKRLWQALSLIMLAASLVASVHLLGHGKSAFEQDGIAPSFFTSNFEHVFRCDQPNNSRCANQAKIAPSLEMKVPYDVLHRAKQQCTQHIASMWDAAKKWVLRSSVILSYRLGSLKAYLAHAYDGVAISPKNSAPLIAAEDDTRSVVAQQPADRNGHGYMSGLSVDTDVPNFFEGPSTQMIDSCAPADESSLDDLQPFVELEIRQEISEKQSIETGDILYQQIPELSDPENIQSSASMCRLPDLLTGIREWPFTDADDLVNTGRQSWTQRFKSVGMTVRYITIAATDIAFSQISEMSDKIVLLFRKLNPALKRLGNDFMVHTETVFLSPDWHRLHGVDHSLVGCALLALFMSAVSMLIFLAGYRCGPQGDGAAVKDHSDSDGDFVTARQTTQWYECTPKAIFVKAPQNTFGNDLSWGHRQATGTTRQGNHSSQDERTVRFYTAKSHGYSTRMRARNNEGGLECADTAGSQIIRG